MSEQVLLCENLGRVYADGERSIAVLDDINFSLPAGEKVAVIGASGSGKSTLLNLLGGLDNPSSGRVLMNGQDLARLGEAHCADCATSSWALFTSFITCCLNLMPGKTSLCRC